jgi:lactate dehydrogenase-like 2-hydroxyacid dehydrogenase
MPETSVIIRAFNEAEYIGDVLEAVEGQQYQDSAFIINVARGPLIDEEALVNAVESDHIRGAGLDVFEEEPPNDSPVLSLIELSVPPTMQEGQLRQKKRK